MSDPCLVELGERRLIAEVLAPRYGIGGYQFGDDCAVVAASGAPGEFTIATTDPCPEPLAVHLGSDDLYHWGWLLATINLSDLAAAGARPTGLLTSLVLPNETRLSEFRRLLDGIDDCAAQYSTRVVGGNLKEGPRLELVATAIGVTKGRPLSRVGTRPGDLVAVVGDFGHYWAAAAVAIRTRAQPGSLPDAVKRPTPELRAGQALHASARASACIDNSDGLKASLWALANANGLGFELSIDDNAFAPEVRGTAEALSIEPLRLACGFGDWNLVCTFPEGELSDLRAAIEGADSRLLVIGRAVVDRGVTVNYRGRHGVLCSPDSERFRPESMFTSGLDQYIENLLHGPLLDGDRPEA